MIRHQRAPSPAAAPSRRGLRRLLPFWGRRGRRPASADDQKEPFVVIVTSAHDPEDGRLTRHALALRSAGAVVEIRRIVAGPRWKRFLIGPLTVFGAIRGADVAVFPDPELFVAGPLAASLRRVRSVIDVHEDYRLVASIRDWIPAGLAGIVGGTAQAHRLVGSRLADATIVASAALHRPGDIVVDNMPDVGSLATSGVRTRRGVYVGDVTIHRGITTIVDLVRAVPELEVDLIGPLSPEARWILASAEVADRIHVHGRRPWLDSWALAGTGLFGISLLADTPTYRSTVPTKVWEYMAAGLAVLASDLPAQADAIRTAGCGAVATGDAETIVRRWLNDPDEAIALGAAGRAWIERLPRNDQALCDAVLGPSSR